MDEIRVGTPAYKALLRRWRELERAAALGLTVEERDEMDRVAAQLDAAETAHDLRHAGSLGVEL